MREKLFLTAFFGVALILIVVVPLAFSAWFEATFPAADAFLDSKTDFIVLLFLIIWLSKSNADYFERKLTSLTNSIDGLRARIEKLEAARNG